MSRNTLSKKLRFEVFKRDRFTCQYCGRMAPDVVLEVDHINPVAEGGSDDILNLITSCRDCNRGKGKVPITENDALKKQQNQLLALADRKEQIEMMATWRKELSDIEDCEIDIVSDTISMWAYDREEWSLSPTGRNKIRLLLKRFTLEEIISAVEISYARYYEGTDYTWNTAFNKIGGICYNRRNKG